MSGSFFWLAIFPMILGGIILAMFILHLKKEVNKPENSGSKRMTPEKFINEVAQEFDIDSAKAGRIVEVVFSYFPGFNWKKNLPRVRDGKLDEGHEENARKSDAAVEDKEIPGGSEKPIGA